MGLPVNESELAGTDLFVPQPGSAEPHPAEARPLIHPAHPRPRNQPFLPESSDCIAPLAGPVGLESSQWQTKWFTNRSDLLRRSNGLILRFRDSWSATACRLCVHPPYVAQSAIVVECERLPFQASVVVRLGLARRRVSEREEQDKQEHSNE